MIFMIISENVCIIESSYSSYSTREPRNRVPKSPSGKKRTDQFQIYNPAALISNLASAPAEKKAAFSPPVSASRSSESSVDSCCSMEILDTPRRIREMQRAQLLFSTAISRFALIARTIVLSHFRARKIYPRVESKSEYIQV